MKRRGNERYRGIVPLVLLAAVLPAASHSGRPAGPRKHWAFQPLRRPPVPSIQNPKSKIQNPIDSFVIHKLESKKLAMAPRADRRTLIRRLTFDLTGLPPTPEEIEAYLSDKSDRSYEKLVNRLLASPRYGERWGRHWLDVARYADSDGRESDHDRPNAYHYRDFVIWALNLDLPFNTFVRWQLAGDEIEPNNSRAVAATGFIVAGPRAQLPDNLLEEERIRERYNTLDDMISTTGQAFLGLTIGCARCHDHKYDPITIRDYYRLSAAFNAGDRAEIPKLPWKEWDRWRKDKAKWLQDLARARDEKNQEAVKDLETKWSTYMHAIYAMCDSQPQPPDTWLLDRGSFMNRKEKVQLGFIAGLTNGPVPAEWVASAKSRGTRTDTTYQRRALADWLVDTQRGPGALLARVIVNRLWQGHMGEGLVRTANDFGRRAERPSHPELLDWLAAELVSPKTDSQSPSAVNGQSSSRQPWSLKHIHRLIVTSDTYKQASVVPQAAVRFGQSVDPENRLLWRQRPRRVESEVYRDSLLSVAGTLNPEMFGPAFRPPIQKEANQARNVQDPYPSDAADSPETRRRTVYMFHKRVIPYPLLQVLDGPDASASCGKRSVTTVAPQALAVLNEPFVRLRSDEFARRLIAEGGKENSARICRAYLLALGRAPKQKEIDSGVRFLEKQAARRQSRDAKLDARFLALADYAQVIFGLNEFLYVD